MKRTYFTNVGNGELRCEFARHEGSHPVPGFENYRFPIDAADAARLANKAFSMGYDEALRDAREALGLKP